MLKNLFFGCLFLSLGLILTGCGKKTCDSGTAPDAVPAQNAVPDAVVPEESKPDLNIEDSTSPEGVTENFLKSFFSGDDENSFALLTTKAQLATQDTFTAEASDTIKWEITKKTLTDNGIAYVFVSVEDLTEAGETETEELVFALTNVENRWGVAGFSAGGLAINFENCAVDSLVETSSDSNPVQVGQNPVSEPAIR